MPAPGDAPAGTLAYQANYPTGSYNPSGTPRGGFGFYIGDPEGFSFEGATEVLASYAVYFEPGFQVHSAFCTLAQRSSEAPLSLTRVANYPASTAAPTPTRRSGAAAAAKMTATSASTCGSCSERTAWAKSTLTSLRWLIMMFCWTCLGAYFALTFS